MPDSIRGPGRRVLAAVALALVTMFLYSGGCAGRISRQVLHVVWTSDILSLDPNEQFEFATDTMSMNVFEPLLRYDTKLSFAPVLAERWEISDRRKWTFHLRSGVKFHDGSDVTAEDIVFTIRRIQGRPKSGIYPYLSGVSSVRAIDSRTIEVISDRPAALLSILSFVYILPRRLLETQGEKAFFQHPVGTGPYQFAEWVPNHHLSLQAFSAHRDGPTAFSKVVFLHLGDRNAMWSEAKAHAPAIIISPSRASWIAHEGDPGFRLLSRPGINVQYLVCNMRTSPKNPLADRRVREALHAAIDYPLLTRTVSGGQSFPASQYVTADIVGFNPAITVPPFSPGRAARLLADAGYPGGIELTLNCLGGNPALVAEVTRQFGQANIRVKSTVATSIQFFERLARCEADLHLTGWFCSTGDASELFEGNFSTLIGVASDPASAGCGYGGKELDALVDRIAKTLEPGDRLQLLQQAMKRVVDDLPWIPLLVPYDRYALTEGVRWEPRADGEIFLADVKAN